MMTRSRRVFATALGAAGLGAVLSGCAPTMIGTAAVGVLVATDRRTSGAQLEDRQLVEQIVSRVENVRAIVNELGVMGNSTLTQRSSDSLITGRVKAAMVDAKDIFANSFKVVTERGTTYLMGRVTQREANRATEITRSTSGVQRVVRVLEIISEEELQRTLPQEPPRPAASAPRP